MSPRASVGLCFLLVKWQQRLNLAHWAVTVTQEMPEDGHFIAFLLEDTTMSLSSWASKVGFWGIILLGISALWPGNLCFLLLKDMWLMFCKLM
jgi:hypothetical protein